MIELKYCTAVIMASLLAATGAAAQSGSTADKTVDSGVKIVSKDAKGKATRVSVDGKEYAVCMTEQQDSCINPRQAGLNFGDWPLKNWPEKNNR
ncbi:hypothetical protein C8024_05830 [Sphingopyxis sp. BSNA05]|uniref:hypothetical protein n=1 Tax=Sphingopyxis sp. BSNA05 TaxID=1236614 RepID=UPI0015652313|nr:hypothetical protein [Sphingopyxis sp. BSNA05]NRD89069.1 hypothetical protein [Sphingopyxis sp. BSNA05]